MSAVTFRKAMRGQRRALIGFGLGVALYVIFLVAFFPTVRDQGATFQKLLDSYPPAIRAAFGIETLTTGAGYLQAELFGFTLPALFLVYAIGRGSDLVAGEEERGQLELPLATPVTRRALAWQKGLALVAGLGVLALALLVVTLAGGAAFGLGLPAGDALAEVAALWLFASAFGALALALGAATGRRGLATAATVGVAAAMYVLDLVAKLVPSAAGLRWASLFYYYGGHEPLLHGADWPGLAALALITAILVLVGVLAFDRRDVGRA